MALVQPDSLAHLTVLRDSLVNSVTGQATNEAAFVDARMALLKDPEVRDLLPKWLRFVRSVGMFWTYVRENVNSNEDYEGFIYDELEPAFVRLEEIALADDPVDPLFRKVGSDKNDPAPMRPVVALEDLEKAHSFTSPRKSHTKRATKGKRVFLVHGHDEPNRHAVELFLRTIGLEPIVLSKQPNRGRTIIEKFEANAIEVDYAVVLMTADDHGAANGQPAQPRARQNVILELGFFIGRLGRERVAALRADGVEQPSDIDGILYIPLAAGTASWKRTLARELDEAGLPIDMAAVLRA